MDAATAVIAHGTSRTATALAGILLATLVTLALDALPAAAAPGDIDTISGGPGFGPAREVSMSGQVAARGNRLYVADERVVRLVDLDSGVATIYAGTGTFGRYACSAADSRPPRASDVDRAAAAGSATARDRAGVVRLGVRQASICPADVADRRLGRASSARFRAPGRGSDYVRIPDPLQ